MQHVTRVCLRQLGLVCVFLSGPEGVASPTLTSETPWRVRAVWGHVDRVNSDRPLTYQLQFRPTSDTTVVKYAALSLCRNLSSHVDMHTHAGSTPHNSVTLTFFLTFLTSGSIYAEVLP